jgi:hypothetical protein
MSLIGRLEGAYMPVAILGCAITPSPSGLSLYGFDTGSQRRPIWLVRVRLAAISSPWGGFCDAPAIATGQHWHCQWGMGFSMCGWKWADNTDATAPY